jgi:hypothetical protein
VVLAIVMYSHNPHTIPIFPRNSSLGLTKRQLTSARERHNLPSPESCFPSRRSRRCGYPVIRSSTLLITEFAIVTRR